MQWISSDDLLYQFTDLGSGKIQPESIDEFLDIFIENIAAVGLIKVDKGQQ